MEVHLGGIEREALLGSHLHAILDKALLILITQCRCEQHPDILKALKGVVSLSHKLAVFLPYSPCLFMWILMDGPSSTY